MVPSSPGYQVLQLAQWQVIRRMGIGANVRGHLRQRIILAQPCVGFLESALLEQGNPFDAGIELANGLG